MQETGDADVLKKLKKKDLDEVRNLARPPLAVRRSLEVVQALLIGNETETLPPNTGQQVRG